MASNWSRSKLSTLVSSLEAGVSVNSNDRPPSTGELGVLKTSAISGGRFNPNESKTVLPAEWSRVCTNVKANCIIVSRMNTPDLVGESALVEHDYPSLFLPDRLWLMTVQDDRCQARWLSHFLRSSISRRFISLSATGTSGSMKNLPKPRLLAMPVDAPPLPEQRAIATVLDTIDDAIQKTEQIIAKLQQVKQGLLHDLLTRGIDDNGELRDPDRHPEQFQDSPMGRIPKGWTVKQLREVAEISKLAGFEYTLHVRYCEDGEVIAIRPLNIKNERIELSDVQRITKRVSDALPRSKVDAGDVVFTYIGAYVGEVALVHESDRFHLAPNICRIRAGFGTSPCFLMWTLRSQQTQRQIARLVAVTATPSMTMASVRSLLVRVPPIAQQLEIVHRIEAAFGRQRAEECVAVSLRSLKAGLSEDLLTGRVRTTSLPGVAA